MSEDLRTAAQLFMQGFELGDRIQYRWQAARDAKAKWQAQLEWRKQDLAERAKRNAIYERSVMQHGDLMRAQAAWYARRGAGGGKGGGAGAGGGLSEGGQRFIDELKGVGLNVSQPAERPQMNVNVEAPEMPPPMVAPPVPPSDSSSPDFSDAAGGKVPKLQAGGTVPEETGGTAGPGSGFGVIASPPPGYSAARFQPGGSVPTPSGPWWDPLRIFPGHQVARVPKGKTSTAPTAPTVTPPAPPPGQRWPLVAQPSTNFDVPPDQQPPSPAGAASVRSADEDIHPPSGGGGTTAPPVTGGGKGGGGGRGRGKLGDQWRTAAYDPTLDANDPRNIGIVRPGGAVNTQVWAASPRAHPEAYPQGTDQFTPGRDRSGEAPQVVNQRAHEAVSRWNGGSLFSQPATPTLTPASQMQTVALPDRAITGQYRRGGRVQHFQDGGRPGDWYGDRPDYREGDRYGPLLTPAEQEELKRDLGYTYSQGNPNEPGSPARPVTGYQSSEDIPRGHEDRGLTSRQIMWMHKRSGILLPPQHQVATGEIDPNYTFERPVNEPPPPAPRGRSGASAVVEPSAVLPSRGPPFAGEEARADERPRPTGAGTVRSSDEDIHPPSGAPGPVTADSKPGRGRGTPVPRDPRDLAFDPSKQQLDPQSGYTIDASGRVTRIGAAPGQGPQPPGTPPTGVSGPSGAITTSAPVTEPMGGYGLQPQGSNVQGAGLSSNNAAHDMTPISKAASDYAAHQFHLMEPDQHSERGYHAVIAGSGAANPGVMDFIFKKIDPQGQMPMNQKIEKAQAAMYDFWVSKGQPEKASKVAFEIAQFGNQQAKQHGGNAMELLKKGDQQGAINELLSGYNWLPDGHTANFDPRSNTVIMHDLNGQETARIPLQPGTVQNLAAGMASGELGWDIMRSRGSAAPPTPGQPAPQPPSGGGAAPTPAGQAPPAPAAPPALPPTVNAPQQAQPPAAPAPAISTAPPMAAPPAPPPAAAPPRPAPPAPAPTPAPPGGTVSFAPSTGATSGVSFNPKGAVDTTPPTQTQPPAKPDTGQPAQPPAPGQPAPAPSATTAPAAPSKGQPPSKGKDPDSEWWEAVGQPSDKRRAAVEKWYADHPHDVPPTEIRRASRDVPPKPNYNEARAQLSAEHKLRAEAIRDRIKYLPAKGSERNTLLNNAIKENDDVYNKGLADLKGAEDQYERNRQHADQMERQGVRQRSDHEKDKYDSDAPKVLAGYRKGYDGVTDQNAMAKTVRDKIEKNLQLSVAEENWLKTHQSPLRYMKSEEQQTKLLEIGRNIFAQNPGMSAREAAEAAVTYTSRVGDKETGHNGGKGNDGTRFRIRGTDPIGNVVIQNEAHEDVHIPKKIFIQIQNMRDDNVRRFKQETAEAQRKADEERKRGNLGGRAVKELEKISPPVPPEVAPGIPPIPIGPG